MMYMAGTLGWPVRSINQDLRETLLPQAGHPRRDRIDDDGRALGDVVRGAGAAGVVVREDRVRERKAGVIGHAVRGAARQVHIDDRPPHVDGVEAVPGNDVARCGEGDIRGLEVNQAARRGGVVLEDVVLDSDVIAADVDGEAVHPSPRCERAIAEPTALDRNVANGAVGRTDVDAAALAVGELHAMHERVVDAIGPRWSGRDHVRLVVEAGFRVRASWVGRRAADDLDVDRVDNADVVAESAVERRAVDQQIRREGRLNALVGADDIEAILGGVDRGNLPESNAVATGDLDILHLVYFGGDAGRAVAIDREVAEQAVGAVGDLEVRSGPPGGVRHLNDGTAGTLADDCKVVLAADEQLAGDRVNAGLQDQRPAGAGDRIDGILERRLVRTRGRGHEHGRANRLCRVEVASSERGVGGWQAGGEETEERGKQAHQSAALSLMAVTLTLVGLASAANRSASFALVPIGDSMAPDVARERGRVGPQDHARVGRA